MPPVPINGGIFVKAPLIKILNGPSSVLRNCWKLSKPGHVSNVDQRCLSGFMTHVGETNTSAFRNVAWFPVVANGPMKP